MLKNRMQYNDYVIELFPELITDSDISSNSVSVKTITFQLTQDCSLRCTYCYQPNKYKNNMTFETAKKMIDYLFDNKDNPDFYFSEKTTKGLVIDFIGGEPLLCSPLMTKICDYFEDKLLEYPDCPWLLHHRYSISSNGVAYFTPAFQTFLEKHGNNTSVNITIDGCKELHDSCRVFPDGAPSYDMAIKAALDQLEKGNDATKITLAPENISYVFEGFKNMVSLGFRYIFMNSVFEEGWETIHAIELYKQLKMVADYIKENDLEEKIHFILFDTSSYLPYDDEKLNKNWCGTTLSMLALDYKGDIYSCLRFMENSLENDQEPYVLGNLERGIGTTEKEKERIEALNKLTTRNQSTDECINCPIASSCSYCTAYNYQKFGTINKRATFICENHKAGALASKYFYKILNNKEEYDKINLSYEFVKNIISEDEWNSLQWEG